MDLKKTEENYAYELIRLALQCVVWARKQAGLGWGGGGVLRAGGGGGGWWWGDLADNLFI